MENDYKVIEDIETIKELLHCSEQDIIKSLGISNMTFQRWKSNPSKISIDHLNEIYEFAYHNHLNLNKIKELMYTDEILNKDTYLLFHGAKTSIDGKLSINKSENLKDFGNGFYTGDNYDQAAIFVRGLPNSSVYILKFKNDKKYKCKQFFVDTEWMIAIAYFRGKLVKYQNSKLVKEIVDSFNGVDYIIAPIADNRMFKIIDEFIDGEITDIQCQHALSKTNLGMQYVFISQKCLDSVEILEHCFLTESEKKYLNKKRLDDNKIDIDKSKLAKKEYRGKGLYIDQLLK